MAWQTKGVFARLKVYLGLKRANCFALCNQLVYDVTALNLQTIEKPDSLVYQSSRLSQYIRGNLLLACHCSFNAIDWKAKFNVKFKVDKIFPLKRKVQFSHTEAAAYVGGILGKQLHDSSMSSNKCQMFIIRTFGGILSAVTHRSSLLLHVTFDTNMGREHFA